ncbi:MAG: hypothetical protein FWC56_04475 [Phycisphaerae bacterium]|nr:hypothetical protein [Phycisphaerae bacterium]
MIIGIGDPIEPNDCVLPYQTLMVRPCMEAVEVVEAVDPGGLPELLASLETDKSTPDELDVFEEFGSVAVGSTQPEIIETIHTMRKVVWQKRRHDWYQQRRQVRMILAFPYDTGRVS